jgi:hypothetical protein
MPRKKKAAAASPQPELTPEPRRVLEDEEVSGRKLRLADCTTEYLGLKHKRKMTNKRINTRLHELEEDMSHLATEINTRVEVARGGRSGPDEEQLDAFPEDKRDAATA